MLQLRVNFRDGKHTDALLQGDALTSFLQAMAAIGITSIETVQSVDVGRAQDYIPITEISPPIE